MRTLFHSGAFSNRIGKSLAPSLPLVVHTVPGTNFVVHTVPSASFELNKEDGARKEMNNPAVRGKSHFFSGLLMDYALFYYILAVDVALTVEIFLRDRLRIKDSIPA